MTRMANEPARKAKKQAELPDGTFMVLEGVSWEFYKQTLEEFDRSVIPGLVAGQPLAWCFAPSPPRHQDRQGEDGN